MYSYNFSEYGRVYLPVDIKPQDDVVLSPLDFKVDTGADVSTISKKDLRKLGYDLTWVQNNVVIFNDNDKPTTASGDKINAGYVQIPLINILGYEGKQWPFQVIIDENHDFRNLLGRDLLAGFNYSFDNDSDVFTIARSKAFRPRFGFLPDQEINETASEQ